MSHHVAELVNLPPHPADPYVGHLGVRPQGRAAHLGARPGRRRHLRAHRPRRGRQPHPRPGLATSAAGPGMAMKAAGVRRRARRPRRRRSSSERAQAARGTRATTSRRPTPRSSCSCARRPAGSQDYFERRGLPGVELPPRGPDVHRSTGASSCRPRRRSSSGSATSGSPRSARATARSTPSTHALRAALDGRYPALDRIHLTDFKVRVLDWRCRDHRRGGPRARRLDRRRADLDHHRRVGATSSRRRGRRCVDSLVYGLLHADD